MIESAKFTESGTIEAVIDGVKYFIPDDMANRHRQMLAEWEADGNTIEPYEAPPPVLAPLSARQLRLGLVSNGISLSQVEATIDAIENQQDRDVARIEWEYASQYERDHPLIDQIGAALGLTPEQIDDMWMAALEL
jgi:hypothetical protein